ncbi:MAG: ATP-binding cassette domain-containing protein [Actinomycetota bacterium]|nr:ATP-binding cassette domain-containing protein [Actinomycetota bacterium]
MREITGSHVLKISGLCKSFGGLNVLSDFELEIPHSKDMAVAMLGQNGAGKTTLVNLITRILSVDAGAIEVYGNDVLSLPARALAPMGIGRTFQSPRLLLDDTVLDNVLLGAVAAGTWRGQVRRALLADAGEVLESVGLAAQAGRTIRSLPFGSRKLVEVARVLISRPRILLLDEPAAGLSQVEEEHLADVLLQLRRSGMTLLLIEHRMMLVKAVAQRVVMMASGKIVFDGTVSEALASSVVKEGYLGSQVAG